MRHKGRKNLGGTSSDSKLSVELRAKHRSATRISRKRWHARKRVQTILGQPKNHDWDVLMLQGAAMRDVYERERTPTKIPINSKKWLEKKENRVHIGASSKRKRSKPGKVWN